LSIEWGVNTLHAENSTFINFQTKMRRYLSI
jgi:hypothetical protein